MAEQGAVQGHDPDVQISDVEPDRRSPVAPANGDMEELRVVAEGDLAAGVDFVGPDPEVCFGHR
jgi:hypothetical protein